MTFDEQIYEASAETLLDRIRAVPTGWCNAFLIPPLTVPRREGSDASGPQSWLRDTGSPTYPCALDRPSRLASALFGIRHCSAGVHAVRSAKFRRHNMRYDAACVKPPQLIRTQAVDACWTSRCLPTSRPQSSRSSSGSANMNTLYFYKRQIRSRWVASPAAQACPYALSRPFVQPSSALRLA